MNSKSNVIEIKRPKDHVRPSLYISQERERMVGFEGGYMSVRELKMLISWLEDVIEYFEMESEMEPV